MKNLIHEDRGTINLGSKVMISDPCYKLGTWCQGVLENVLPGEYHCKVAFIDEGQWGIRVSKIMVLHKNYLNKTLRVEECDFEVGVDSGTAGIYDYDYYAKYHTDKYLDDVWYGRACDCSQRMVPNPDYKTFEDYMVDVYLRHEVDKLKSSPDSEPDEFWELDARLEYFGNSKYNSEFRFMFDGKPIDGRGIVSSSGYGDGGYPCYISRNSEGQIVSISVEFISPDEEEEDCE